MFGDKDWSGWLLLIRAIVRKVRAIPFQNLCMNALTVCKADVGLYPVEGSPAGSVTCCPVTRQCGDSSAPERRLQSGANRSPCRTGDNSFIARNTVPQQLFVLFSPQLGHVVIWWSGMLLVLVATCLVAGLEAGLLGAGTGEGSCAAPPFRAYSVKWTHGCPGQLQIKVARNGLLGVFRLSILPVASHLLHYCRVRPVLQ